MVSQPSTIKESRVLISELNKTKNFFDRVHKVHSLILDNEIDFVELCFLIANCNPPSNRDLSNMFCTDAILFNQFTEAVINGEN